MRVFVTGATGFIGSAVVQELRSAGHQVVGLTRSEEGAAQLWAAGAEPYHGSIEDPAGIAAGAAPCDGVIHLAFNHDFSRFAQNCAEDRHVIAALGEALAGSGKPLIVTSGTAIASGTPGAPVTEDMPTISSSIVPRGASEEEALAVAAKGVAVSIVRLPQVHDPRRQGLLTFAIAMAQEKGVFAYVGDGQNRWPAAHVLDVALLYRLALERAESGAVYHAVAEEGVTIRAMAEVVAPQLGVPVISVAPEEAEAHFGWLAHFIAGDLVASSAKTREKLDWEPTGPTMLEDLKRLEVETV